MIAPHPCPSCGTLTHGTATEGGLTWNACPECLEQPLSELRAIEIEVLEQSRDWECAVCGCTTEHACPGGCAWVEPNLCSRCAEGIA